MRWGDFQTNGFQRVGHKIIYMEIRCVCARARARVCVCVVVGFPNKWFSKSWSQDHLNGNMIGDSFQRTGFERGAVLGHEFIYIEI